MLQLKEKYDTMIGMDAKESTKQHKNNIWEGCEAYNTYECKSACQKTDLDGVC